MTAMTDEQIIDLWSPRLGEGIQRPVLGKNKIIAFGRACIAAERARADALEAALSDVLEMAQEPADYFAAAFAGYKPERHAYYARALATARALLEKKT